MQGGDSVASTIGAPEQRPVTGVAECLDHPIMLREARPLVVPRCRTGAVVTALVTRCEASWPNVS